MIEVFAFETVRAYIFSYISHISSHIFHIESEKSNNSFESITQISEVHQLKVCKIIIIIILQSYNIVIMLLHPINTLASNRANQYLHAALTFKCLVSQFILLLMLLIASDVIKFSIYSTARWNALVC